MNVNRLTIAGLAGAAIFAAPASAVADTSAWPWQSNADVVAAGIAPAPEYAADVVAAVEWWRGQGADVSTCPNGVIVWAADDLYLKGAPVHGIGEIGGCAVALRRTVAPTPGSEAIANGPWWCDAWQGLVKHEVGHALGFGHDVGPRPDVMSGSAFWSDVCAKQPAPAVTMPEPAPVDSAPAPPVDPAELERVDRANELADRCWLARSYARDARKRARRLRARGRGRYAARTARRKARVAGKVCRRAKAAR